MNWSDLARQQEANNELALLIAANEARAAEAARQHERESQALLTGEQRAQRRELAKAIMETALEHCKRLGIEVGAMYGQASRVLLSPSRMAYYEAFVSKDKDTPTQEAIILQRREENFQRKKLRLKREQEQAMAG